VPTAGAAGSCCQPPRCTLVLGSACSLNGAGGAGGWRARQRAMENGGGHGPEHAHRLVVLTADCSRLDAAAAAFRLKKARRSPRLDRMATEK
jgi:hypothetical protein